jgi:hypothetical protein
MVLKAPGILTFMVSVVLTVTVLIMKFFGDPYFGLRDAGTLRGDRIV